jgi:hypothetical protein
MRSLANYFCQMIVSIAKPDLIYLRFGEYCIEVLHRIILYCTAMNFTLLYNSLLLSTVLCYGIAWSQ